MPAPFMGICTIYPNIAIIKSLGYDEKKEIKVALQDINRFGKVQHIQSIQILLFLNER
jgi:hypothetical protein